MAGAEVVSICDFGDKTLEEMTGGVYKKDKEMKKGTKHFFEGNENGIEKSKQYSRLCLQFYFQNVLMSSLFHQSV